jgi:hypothetical protein
MNFIHAKNPKRTELYPFYVFLLILFPILYLYLSFLSLPHVSHQPITFSLFFLPLFPLSFSFWCQISFVFSLLPSSLSPPREPSAGQPITFSLSFPFLSLTHVNLFVSLFYALFFVSSSSIFFLSFF